MVDSKSYYINNVPVHIRSLPSGHVAVWHPFNSNVAKIISNICRGHGYWDGQYKNWVVFTKFKDAVLNAIEKKCD